MQMVLNISQERRNKITQMDDTMFRTIQLQKTSHKHKLNIPIIEHCCLWCTYNFLHKKCIIPIQKIGETYEGFGSFCSYNCAYTYIVKDGTGISNISTSLALLEDMHMKEYNTYFNKKIVPHRIVLEKYTPNGISIEEYRKNITTINTDIVPNFPSPIERSVGHEVRTTNYGFFTVKAKH